MIVTPRTALLGVVLLLAALALLLLGAGDAAAQGRITARFGDWQIRCERQVGAPSEECGLIQNVEAADRANVSLTVIFMSTADKQARILRVLAPLGVLLPSGMGLSIDNVDVGLAGFVRCFNSGCVAEVQLDPGLVERMEAGQTATFVIFLTPEEGIGIPISLNGFVDGFRALDNPPTVTLETPPTAPVEAATEAVDPASPVQEASFTATGDDGVDPRTALDQLLEDDLFPYVAGAAAAIVLLLLVLSLLVVRGARRNGRRRAEAKAAPAATTAPVATVARGSERQAPRLAPQGERRHVAQDGSEQDPTADDADVALAPNMRPAQNRVPGSPRAPVARARPDRPS